MSCDAYQSVTTHDWRFFLHSMIKFFSFTCHVSYSFRFTLDVLLKNARLNRVWLKYIFVCDTTRRDIVYILFSCPGITSWNPKFPEKVSGLRSRSITKFRRKKMYPDLTPVKKNYSPGSDFRLIRFLREKSISKNTITLKIKNAERCKSFIYYGKLCMKKMILRMDQHIRILNLPEECNRKNMSLLSVLIHTQK